MKKKMLRVVVAGALCASMVMPVMAETGGGAIPTLDGTEVYAGITLDDPDAKVKVEVPTLFAFVVNGVVDADNTDAVKSSVTLGETEGEATVLIPNVKVVVDTPSAEDTDGEYHLETVASGNWSFTNYSTVAATEGAVDGRKGLEVTISGSIVNEGTDEERNHWVHVQDADQKQGEKTGFKQYTLEVDGEKFSSVQRDGSFAMENGIVLKAPDLAVGGVDKTTGYAMVGNKKNSVFNVYVGGQRGQYKQVEESAKVGTIVWTIKAIDQTTTTTAPDAGYLAAE